jgi:hypothetical protein
MFSFLRNRVSREHVVSELQKSMDKARELENSGDANGAYEEISKTCAKYSYWQETSLLYSYRGSLASKVFGEQVIPLPSLKK